MPGGGINILGYVESVNIHTQFNGNNQFSIHEFPVIKLSDRSNKLSNCTCLCASPLIANRAWPTAIFIPGRFYILRSKCTGKHCNWPQLSAKVINVTNPMNMVIFLSSSSRCQCCCIFCSRQRWWQRRGGISAISFLYHPSFCAPRIEQTTSFAMEKLYYSPGCQCTCGDRKSKQMGKKNAKFCMCCGFAYAWSVKKICRAQCIRQCNGLKSKTAHRVCTESKLYAIVALNR